METHELLHNDHVCGSLARSIHYGQGGLRDVPALLARCIREETWPDRIIEPTGERVQYARFVDFVVDRQPNGLGTDVRTLENMCRDDAEALRLLREATVEQGHRSDLDHNMTKVKQRGTSKSYTLDRLHRERPDLYARVVAGGMSANAAAIEAGFRQKTFTVPADPEKAARTLKRHFSAEDLALLKGYLP